MSPDQILWFVLSINWMSFHNVDVTILDLSDFSIYFIFVCVSHIYIHMYMFENNFSIYSNSLYWSSILKYSILVKLFTIQSEFVPSQDLEYNTWVAWTTDQIWVFGILVLSFIYVLSHLCAFILIDGALPQCSEISMEFRNCDPFSSKTYFPFPKKKNICTLTVS